VRVDGERPHLPNQDNDTLKTIKLYGEGVKKVVSHLDFIHSEEDSLGYGKSEMNDTRLVSPNG